MPSSGSAKLPKVDRSTSPLPNKPVNPVQELKALFAEPPLRVSNGGKEQDFRFEAIQCLQSTAHTVPKALPDRGTWSSKVNPRESLSQITNSGEQLLQSNIIHVDT